MELIRQNVNLKTSNEKNNKLFVLQKWLFPFNQTLLITFMATSSSWRYLKWHSSITLKYHFSVSHSKYIASFIFFPDAPQEITASCVHWKNSLPPKKTTTNQPNYWEQSERRRIFSSAQNSARFNIRISVSNDMSK